ncbi:hypothetical protein [Photobacterium iliopiscarium]|uniref:SPOR domain-containing protein n=1 Tax=Photobacterium iliopiscarium TaxID=56192 RepID=A0ABX5GM91_9GAMM|nr:hypothetical protein [Photobacterium iliopiscarium]PSW91245.1 hypothetical protein C9J52_19525 [Photobacterium iliopiscarium]
MNNKKTLFFKGLISLLLCNTLNFAHANSLNNNRVDVLNTDLKLPITMNFIDSQYYYVQVLYTKQSQANALDKIQEIQQSIQYPTAMQPFDSGYRLYIGAVKGSDLLHIKKLLRSIGYNDYLLRKANKIKPSLKLKDIVFQQFGKINSKDIILPRYKDGSLALFDQVDTHFICQSINPHATIALESEYGGILSKIDAISAIGLQYRFWLTSNRTVTRVSDNLVMKTAAQGAKYPLICTTKLDS